MADGEKKGLPIASLIAAPLKGAADASSKLAQSTAQYIERVGFERTDDDTWEPRQVDFQFDRPKMDPATGEVYMEEVHIQLPLLAIAPPPNLQIDMVDVDFNLEIRTASKSVDEEDKRLEEEGHEQGIELFGVTTAHRENTRRTDTSSKYHFKLTATNHGVPEALARVLDMMAAGVGPHKVIDRDHNFKDPDNGGEDPQPDPPPKPTPPRNPPKPGAVNKRRRMRKKRSVIT